MSYFHQPVLLKEVVDYLKPKSGGVYLDGTLGGGGYAEAILTASSPDGVIVGIDVDDDALDAAKARLAGFGPRIKIERASYKDVSGKYDGIVLDLGVSSPQLDEAGRGFSFLKNAPLDMRMDKAARLTAGDIVNSYSEDNLGEIFKEFGEERFFKRISRSIVEFRGKKVFETTAELAEVCKRAYPPAMRYGRTHPATRVFQALRIVVNSELGNLKTFLANFSGLLKEDGRLVIVSYHSLEDRLVKRRFLELAKGSNYGVLTKKPVTPTADEIQKNPRARSAKLRALKATVLS